MLRFLELINYQEMFLNSICMFVFWTVMSELSYFLSKFTTIGTTDKFGDFIFWLENIVKFKLKKEELAASVLRLSYSKGFICRPCHSFWICLIIHAFFFSFLYSLIVSLLTYKIIEQYVEK